MVVNDEGEEEPVLSRTAQVKRAIAKPVATTRDRTTVALMVAALFVGLIGPLGGVAAAALVFVASSLGRR